MLLDSFNRLHNSLRISVTDRCNIRCFYCMPVEEVRFLPRRELLSFEEIARFVKIVARLGVDKLRLTGGEPLVRSDLHVLVGMLATVPGIRDIALTTNGILLAFRTKHSSGSRGERVYGGCWKASPPRKMPASAKFG
jgi:GTP 3',8-cyclase